MQSRLPFFILICFFSLCLPDLQAQSFYNWKRDRKLTLGIGLGTTNYYGDLNNTGQVLKFSPNIALNIEYPLAQRINLRLELMHYQIEGDDNEYEGDDFPEDRYVRNLSFKANNFELNAVGVFSLFKENIKYYQRSKFNPYAVVGIGITTVNPKAFYQGEWYKLRELQTEGVEYKSTSLIIPFGAGVKFKVTNSFNLALEAVYRVTFTDYLDDVSTVYVPQSSFTDPIAAILADRRQELGIPPAKPGAIRGGPDSNDGYLVFSIKGSYYLPTSEWMRRWGSKRPKRLR